MTPLRFYVYPRREIERVAPISKSFLVPWEALRPGVLDDNSIDVFLPNCRSEKHDYTRFDLFERVENVTDSSIVIVCNSWLELLDADGQRHKIADLMNEIRSQYPLNPKVWSWNSDVDEAMMHEFQDLPPNEFVLSYNTSRYSPNDIGVPCWAIEARQKWDADAERVYRGGFIGYVGGVKVRQDMKAAFSGREGWFIHDTTQIQQSQSVYLEYMKQFDFALCPRGGGLSSYRFWEALQCGCIPILFADDVALPYPNFKWGEIICRVSEKDAGSFDVVWDLIGGIDVKKRRKHIAAVRQLFQLGGVQTFIYRQIKDYLE